MRGGQFVVIPYYIYTMALVNEIWRWGKKRIWPSVVAFFTLKSLRLVCRECGGIVELNNFIE